MRAGHSVSLVAGRSDLEGSEIDLQVEHRIVPSLSHTRLGVDAVSQIDGAVRELRPDIIHLHDATHPAVVARLRERAPVIASAHGYPGCAPNTYYFSPGHECTRPNGPLCVLHMAFHGCLHSKDLRAIPGAYASTKLRLSGFRSADSVVAYSNAVRKNLMRNNVASHIVPLFPTVSRTREAIPYQNSDVILFVGRIVPAKGLHVLISALPEVRGRLIVCGDGWARNQCEENARRLNVDSRVEFLGWVREKRLASLFACATVVAVPSVWPEPFGLVGVEAMAYGVPAVGSATGGIPEWLTDGENGRLVPPGDPQGLARALNDILGDSTVRARFSSAARRRADTVFTENRHVAALEAVYAATLARRN